MHYLTFTLSNYRFCLWPFKLWMRMFWKSPLTCPWSILIHEHNLSAYCSHPDSQLCLEWISLLYRPQQRLEVWHNVIVQLHRHPFFLLSQIIVFHFFNQCHLRIREERPQTMGSLWVLTRIELQFLPCVCTDLLQRQMYPFYV